MIMKNIKTTYMAARRHCHKLLALPLACAIAFTSCSDWSDHYDESGVEGSDVTLWEQITSRPELSDFAEVLTQTKVFRHHKKTATSYADILMGGQSLTVLAPLNGTFNKDSLLQLVQTAEGDSAVERFFVMNHLIRAPRTATAAGQNVRMLNNKRVTLNSEGVSGVPFTQSNIRAKNGIMHIMDTKMPYVYTLYEALTHLPQFEDAGILLKSYNEDYFNEEASISSGLVNGIPVYVDSVITERNKFINALVPLNSEDSTYAMCVPTLEGWRKAWAEAESYFRYPTSMEKYDSLQKFNTGIAMLGNAIYLSKWQSNINDSVVSIYYNRNEPNYGVFYKPFAAEGLFGSAKGVEQCSNGKLYYYDESPFDITKTYFKKIEKEAEYTWDILEYTKCSYNSRNLTADSISKDAYLEITPARGNDNWTVTYKLSNTLSGSYDFCLMVLPKSVEGPTGDIKRPAKFKVAINYVDEEGKPQKHDCFYNVYNEDGSLKKQEVNFENDPTRVDTIMVAEGFKLPASNYGQNNNNVTITITLNIGPRDNTKYNRVMYLDGIFLRPSKPTTEE